LELGRAAVAAHFLLIIWRRPGGGTAVNIAACFIKLNYGKIFLFPVRKSTAITARIPASVPGGDAGEGVAVGVGIVVTTIVVGKGVVAVEVTGTVVGRVVAGRSAFGVGSAVIFNGTPSWTATFAFDADPGFSTLMENVRVAVPEDVWNATIARPSRSVVTRA
jgi:hypothetical protein